jgi:hypothetical protein
LSKGSTFLRGCDEACHWTLYWLVQSGRYCHILFV